MRVLKSHERSVIDVAFSPDGRYLAAACNDTTVALHDSHDDYAKTVLGKPTTGMLSYYHKVAFSPDGGSLVGYAARGGMRVWDVGTRQCRAALMKGDILGSWMDCSPRSPVVVAMHWTIGRGQRTRAWDLVTCEEIKLSREWREELGFVFHPAGDRVLTSNGEILSWPDGVEVGRLHTTRPFGFVWSPGGRWLAGLHRNEAEVFDPASGEMVAEFRLDTVDFQAAAFTPDDRFLITVSNERLAKLWDTSTWQPREALDWRVGKLKSVAVSPDGMRAAAGSERGRVVVWDL